MTNEFKKTEWSVNNLCCPSPVREQFSRQVQRHAIEGKNGSSMHSFCVGWHSVASTEDKTFWMKIFLAFFVSGPFLMNHKKCYPQILERKRKTAVGDHTSAKEINDFRRPIRRNKVVQNSIMEEWNWDVFNFPIIFPVSIWDVVHVLYGLLVVWSN